jgi:hypothetical protein
VEDPEGEGEFIDLDVVEDDDACEWVMMISNIRMQSFTGTIMNIYWCNNDLYYIITWLNVSFD